MASIRRRVHRPQFKRERNAQDDKRLSAKLSYARIPVQKVCFVLDAIRGKDVKMVLGILVYSPGYASSVIKKLVESAIANIENNNNLQVDKSHIAEYRTSDNPIMKRAHPRAQGRAYRIFRRVSHIMAALDKR